VPPARRAPPQRTSGVWSGRVDSAYKGLLNLVTVQELAKRNPFRHDLYFPRLSACLPCLDRCLPGRVGKARCGLICRQAGTFHNRRFVRRATDQATHFLARFARQKRVGLSQGGHGCSLLRESARSQPYRIIGCAKARLFGLGQHAESSSQSRKPSPNQQSLTQRLSSRRRRGQ